MSKAASSAVERFSYDAQTKLLEIVFRSGGVYQYLDVDASTVAWLEKTPHKGAYVNRVIKKRFQYKDVTPSPEPQDLAALLQRSLEKNDT